MRRPNFGPFKGLEYFLACEDAANLSENYQSTLIQQWMMRQEMAGEVRSFKIRPGSRIHPELMKLVPCFLVDYTVDPTTVYESVLVETLHLTKEMAVCMYVHDS